jgi:VCBS repeat-containing protein
MNTVGTYGTFTLSESGEWTFTANGNFDELNVGDTVTETFNVTSIDGTASTVSIQINGSNDAAIVMSVSKVIDETDAPVSTSGQLTASDLDNTDNTFVEVFKVGTYGTFNLSASGEWSFTANSAFNTLNVGDNLLEVFNVSSIDGTASTVTIQISGTNDAATVTSASQTLIETDLPLSTSGQLTASDVDNTDNIFKASTINGRYGQLTIDTSGTWIFTANSAFNSLNVGDKISETFNVFSVDGTETTVTIQINGSRELEIDDNENNPIEDKIDLNPFPTNEDVSSSSSADFSVRNAVGIEIDLNVDYTIDILGEQSQDAGGVLSDNILMSVLNERLTDNNDNDVAQSTVENTQTFLQELASIWTNNQLEAAAPINNVIADNNPRSAEFLEDLDKMQQELDASAEKNKIINDLNVGTVTGVGITSAALFVSWLLRGGSLLASLLTAMPAWRSLDVLPILTADETLRNAQSGDVESGTASTNIDALFEDQGPSPSPDERIKR